MPRWRTALAAIVLLGLLSGGDLLAAPPLQDDQYVINSPGDNATVSGVVEIRGTVTHPNFNSYGVLYAPGPAPTADSQWTIIVFGVEQQVVNDVLAEWDTAALTEDGQPVVPNGVYTLALARYRDGREDPDLYYVRSVTVNNEDVTPTPAPTDTAEPLPTAAQATPTSVPVEQPPTSTPRPSRTPAPDGSGEADSPSDDGGADTGEEEEEGEGLAIDVGRLRSAFMRGMRITLLLFGLWGLYIFGKAGVRYYLRTRRSGPRGGETG